MPPGWGDQWSTQSEQFQGGMKDGFKEKRGCRPAFKERHVMMVAAEGAPATQGPNALPPQPGWMGRNNGLLIHIALWRRGRDTLTFALLGRSAKEKLLAGLIAAAHDFANLFPGGIFFPSKSLKVPSDFFPSVSECRTGHEGQIIPSIQGPMATPEAAQRHLQPAEDKPRGHVTVLVHFIRCFTETLLACIPASQAQEQCSDYSLHSVSHIRNQLNRQQGKRLPSLLTQKTGNGNLSLPPSRKQINRAAVVGSNHSIALMLLANGADRSDNRREIDPPGHKRFPVFPDALKRAKVGQLYGLAALLPRGRVLGSDNRLACLLGRVVIFTRSISYLDILPILISSVAIPRKYSSLHRHHSGVDNTRNR